MTNGMAVVKLLIKVFLKKRPASLADRDRQDMAHFLLGQPILVAALKNALALLALVLVDRSAAAILAPALQAIRAAGTLVEVADRKKPAALAACLLVLHAPSRLPTPWGGA